MPEPEINEGGRRRTRGRKTTMKVKTLRRLLKSKGKKTTGKRATLLKRLHMRGGSGLSPHPFAAGGEDTMGPLSRAGNSGEADQAYAAGVQRDLDIDQKNQQKIGGRRRRRSSSSSGRR
jgi:hypothetical protein